MSRTHIIINSMIGILNKICHLKETGVNIVHEERPKELCWAWVNQDTNQTINTIGLNQIKEIMRFRDKDPRIKLLFGFVAGADPCTTRSAINKLEKMKAFW